MSILIALALGLAAIASAYFVGWSRGFRRARELSACEPSLYGHVHFVDGPIRQFTTCTSASAAIERLMKEHR